MMPSDYHSIINSVTFDSHIGKSGLIPLTDSHFLVAFSWFKLETVLPGAATTWSRPRHHIKTHGAYSEMMITMSMGFLTWPRSLIIYDIVPFGFNVAIAW